MMNDLTQKIQSCSAALLTALMVLTAACSSPQAPGTPPEPVSPPVAPTPTEPTAASATPAAPVPATASPSARRSAPPPSPAARANWADLPGWQQDNHADALPALLGSCKVLANQAAWRDVCNAAPTIKGAAARQFFETRFTPYRISSAEGSLDGLVTGYYEPILRGSRKQSARNRYPVYGAPDDLLTLDLGETVPELKTAAPRVRLAGKRVVPYHARAVIDGENSPLRGKEIAWVEDAVELFFLQVQGSGRIALEEGGVMRVGFAEHNGLQYRSIGRVLIERRELTVDGASMQGIKAWARANPTRLTELLNQNPRYVFFRELTGTATSPPGSLGVPLTPQRSVAVDPRFVMLGAPVYLNTTWPNTTKPLQRLMLAQDTGGAILGAVRADFFWGSGEEAAREAGRMQQVLRMWVLLPNGASTPSP